MNKKTFLIGLVIAIILIAWFGPNFYTTPNEAKRKAKIEAMVLEMVLDRNHYNDSLRNAIGNDSIFKSPRMSEIIRKELSKREDAIRAKHGWDEMVGQ